MPHVVPIFRKKDVMRGYSSHPLQLFDDPISGSGEQYAPDAASGVTREERNRAELLACREAWRPYPSRRPTSKHEPYSLAWFQEIETRRYARQGWWMPKLLEFNRHRGEQVLGLGEGLGTDWVRFAEGGAQVHCCSPSAGHAALVRRNFDLRRLKAQILRGAFTALPLADDSMDVVCLSGLASSFEQLDAVVREVYRVLKPGGKILAVFPAKYNAHYWQDFWFPWNRWFDQRRADAEACFSGRTLQRILGQFAEHRIHKRHLRRSDLPHVWRWMLLPMLERIMGRYLVAKAFKPLRAGALVSLAA
jgi:SAM-dependent methyltransferase